MSSDDFCMVHPKYISYLNYIDTGTWTEDQTKKHTAIFDKGLTCVCHPTVEPNPYNPKQGKIIHKHL